MRGLSPDPVVDGQADPRAATTPVVVPPPGYQRAAELGFQEYEHGNYEEARARFLEAHRLWPNARVLRALGHCEFELAHYVAAVEFLQQTLSSSARPLSEEQRRETEQLLARARSHVARIVVQTVPAAAHVLIDGADPRRDLAGAVMLVEGAHAIEVHAPGYLTGHRELAVTGSVDRVVQIALEPVPAPRHRQAEQSALRKKWWLWTGVAAVGAAGVATALALSLREPGEGKIDGGSTEMVIPVGRAGGATP